jgi:transposase-like protein
MPSHRRNKPPRNNRDADKHGSTFDAGTADVSATVECPYCGESVDITLDPDGGASQHYVQDCEVCCRPWQVSVAYDAEGHAEVSVTALDE